MRTLEMAKEQRDVSFLDHPMSVAHRLATKDGQLSDLEIALIEALRIKTAMKEIVKKRDDRRASRQKIATPTIDDRFDTVVLAAIKSLKLPYRRSQSHWVGGNHNIQTAILSEGSPTAGGGSTKEWSKKRNWSGTNSHWYFTVRRDWLSKVVLKNLTLYKGELVLDVDDAGGILVVKQSTGFNLKTVRIKKPDNSKFDFLERKDNP